MSILLTRNRNLASSSFACINPSVDGCATLTSPSSEVVLRSYSVSSRQSCNDGDGKQQGSNVSKISLIKETSVAPTSEVAQNVDRVVTPVTDTRLKRIKRSYKLLHLNYLFSLAFMIIYMFFGALLFLWLEGPSDEARKLHEYKFYIHERELFLKQLDEIYDVEASQHRKFLLKKAIDYLHRQIGVSFSNRSEWSLTTALYYSGTILTTIGYGDVACITSGGRLMTVIYGIVGIPIMLITLRDLGNFLYEAMINAIRLVHFISRQCRIFDRKTQKTSIQQNKNDLLELESGVFDGTDNELENENDDNHSKEPKFHLGDEFIEASVKEDDTKVINADDTVLSNSNLSTRIPVLLAIGITFSWIFLCAGLFKIWERDWTYAESCYFMFISLSTIGLGDLSVRRRDLMIMCFIFVIFGLAMVSMCISVIQTALEDFYIKVFLKLFLEYQSKLNQGNDEVGASVGMMQMWGNNRKAKYLMSFLSENRRASVFSKAQKDAEARGIEIPAILSDIDEESGMPKLFSKDIDETTLTATVEEAIQQQPEAKQHLPIQSSTELSLPKTIFYDMGVQTCLLSFDDKGEQTLMIPLLDTAIVTDPLINEMVEEAAQCPNPTLIHSTMQTEVVELRDSGCITENSEYETRRKIRTGTIKMKERSLQEPFEPRRSLAGASMPGKMELNEDDEVIDEDEEPANLDWDPIDGLHAEKQLRVRYLKQFFETNEKRGSIRRRSQRKLSVPPSPLPKSKT